MTQDTFILTDFGGLKRVGLFNNNLCGNINSEIPANSGDYRRGKKLFSIHSQAGVRTPNIGIIQVMSIWPVDDSLVYETYGKMIQSFLQLVDGSLVTCDDDNPLALEKALNTKHILNSSNTNKRKVSAQY